MPPGRFPVILAPPALVLVWLSCPSPAAPVGVPATFLPDPAQLFSEPFDLGPDNPTVEFEFVPTKQGRHSAVAVWDGDEELQVSVGGGKCRSGGSGLVWVFAGAVERSPGLTRPYPRAMVRQ